VVSDSDPIAETLRLAAITDDAARTVYADYLSEIG
jgi:hypothetical protein